MHLARTGGARRFAVEFWGVTFAVEWTDPQWDEQMANLLLPNWTVRDDLKPEAVFRLTEDEHGTPLLELPDDTPWRAGKPSLDTLERNLQLYLGNTTREAVFVHAGVVGWHGGALVLPDRSLTGKSTLTRALGEAEGTATSLLDYFSGVQA